RREFSGSSHSLPEKSVHSMVQQQCYSIMAAQSENTPPLPPLKGGPSCRQCRAQQKDLGGVRNFSY
ncbi:MAG: hypothetical protein PHS63_03805, partial [Desulfoplanes sp.]|nr:hypothetical protein [Desulfoplanes sp.]